MTKAFSIVGASNWLSTGFGILDAPDVTSGLCVADFGIGKKSFGTGVK